MQAKASGAERRRLFFNFSRTSSQLLTVQTVRMAFLAIVLLITVLYQVVNSTFVAFDVFFNVYGLLAVSFFFNCAYTLSIDRLKNAGLWTALLFIWETLYVSLLIYFIGVNQSLLVFLYLINIILCGIVFQRKGGVYLSVLTAVSFSVLLATDPQMSTTTRYIAMGINNLAFFTVAYLSGYLSEQLNFMGVELQERGRDIKLLKNLNSLIIDNMPAGMLTVDNEGMVLQHNSRALELLSSPKSLIGESIFEVYSPFGDYIDSVDSPFVKEFTMGAAQGRKVLRTQFSPLYDEAGEQKGSIMVFEDVGQLKKLEDRVRQSEKMAAIGQLAAGIAHEIRNPLASISGSIQLLQAERAGADGSNVADDQKLMGIVIREIDRLNKLISEFLEYARPQEPIGEIVPVSDLMEEMMETVKLDTWAKGVTFNVSIQPGVTLRGNYDKLKQAFWNIIINGLQSMDKSSAKQLSVTLSKSGTKTVVKFKDSGCGIAAEQIYRIFEPFHTTKPKGTGLGLAIVHSILENHAAEIDVKSELEKGTEFTLTFGSGDSGPKG